MAERSPNASQGTDYRAIQRRLLNSSNVDDRDESSRNRPFGGNSQRSGIVDDRPIAFSTPSGHQPLPILSTNRLAPPIVHHPSQRPTNDNIPSRNRRNDGWLDSDRDSTNGNDDDVDQSTITSQPLSSNSTRRTIAGKTNVERNFSSTSSGRSIAGDRIASSSLSTTVLADQGDGDEDWVLAMLESLPNHPRIWSLAEPGYKYSTTKEQSWKDIGAIVGERCGLIVTDQFILSMRTRWKTIRDAWRKEKRKPTGSAADKTPYKYTPYLKFLENQVRHRTTTGNLDAPRANDHQNATIENDDDDIHLDESASSHTNDLATTSSSSSTTKNKKRPRTSRDSYSNEFDVECLELIRDIRDHSTTAPSKHAMYGDLVASVLDKLPYPSKKYKDAIGRLMTFVHDYTIGGGEDSDVDG